MRTTALLLLLGLVGVRAETVALAAGEYAPFVGAGLPDGGVTAAIVAAAFKAQGGDTQLTYLPWKRGFMETQQGRYVGTFPYLRTPEREREFLYSQPIYADQFRLHVRANAPAPKHWQGRAVCVPLGYDTTQISAFVQANAIRIEQPAEIAHCFYMLEKGRVDAVWASELVAAATTATILGSGAKVRRLDLTLVGPVHYYLIVSRQLPNAQAWVQRFNQGLQRIRANGQYQRLVQRYAVGALLTPHAANQEQVGLVGLASTGLGYLDASIVDPFV